MHFLKSRKSEVHFERRNFIHWNMIRVASLHWEKIMTRFSLQGYHFFLSKTGKWTFSCRHLASLLLGCLWTKNLITSQNLCTCLISLMAMTSISTVFQPLPIDWHTPLLQWHLRQKERHAWCPARTHSTCNNFSKMTIGKIPKMTSNFAVSKSLLLQSIHDVFVDVLRQSEKSSGCLEVKGVAIQSFLHQVVCAEKQIVSRNI